MKKVSRIIISDSRFFLISLKLNSTRENVESILKGRTLLEGPKGTGIIRAQFPLNFELGTF